MAPPKRKAPPADDPGAPTKSDLTVTVSVPPRGLEFALKIAARGYRVHPVRWPSKAPILKDWPTKASTDPSEIEKMWRTRPRSAVGVACGPELAVDLDEKMGMTGIQAWTDWCADNAVDLEDFAQRTLSGGAHILYTLPEGTVLGDSSGTLPDGIDIRGYGGQIVAYELLPEISTLHVAPEPLLAALRRPEKPERHSTSATVRDPALGLHPYAARAIGYELDRLDECARGGDLWDTTSFEVSCNLIEFSNSVWSGYTLEMAHADFLNHAPVDNAGFPESRRNAKWESALQTVGDNDRPEPEGQYLTPQEVFDEWVEQAQHRIFDATPILQHIRQAAHSRMLGSGAVLANVLGRVLAEVPPGVVLPPTIGSEAPLNLGFAMVGQSGDGKSATYKCGAEVLGLRQNHLETGVGSGEGLIEAFLEEQTVPDPRDPTKTVKVKGLVTPPSRIFHVDEVEHLTKASGRDGATIMSILRTALTGGSMKSANATAERRRSVDAGSYRLIVYIGVQPGLSGALLNDADAGTPQRLLWISTVDRTVPLEPPEWPGSLEWAGVVLYAQDYHVQYPKHIKDLLIRQRYDRVHGQGDPLESHLMLTRLKVAAALAFLHDEMDITDQWWTIAGHLMEWSKLEQQRCRDSLNKTKVDGYVKQGQAEAIKQQASEDQRLKNVEAGLLRAIEKTPGVSWSAARHSIRANNRELAEDALESLVAAGVVRVEDFMNGPQKGKKLWLRTKAD